MVKFVFNKELGSFVVARSHAHIVLLVGQVVVGKTPVDETEVPLGMVDHNIERLHVSVHDAVGVRVLERLQDFKSVEPDIHGVELVVQLLRLDVRNVLKHEARRLRGWVSQHVVQLNDIGASEEGLQNFGLAVDFFGPDRLQNFNDAGLVVVCIDSLEHLGVLPSAELLLDLVVVHFVPRDLVFIVVGVVLRSLSAHVLIRPREGQACFH